MSWEGLMASLIEQSLILFVIFFEALQHAASSFKLMSRVTLRHRLVERILAAGRVRAEVSLGLLRCLIVN